MPTPHDKLTVDLTLPRCCRLRWPPGNRLTTWLDLLLTVLLLLEAIALLLLPKASILPVLWLPALLLPEFIALSVLPLPALLLTEAIALAVLRLPALLLPEATLAVLRLPALMLAEAINMPVLLPPALLLQPARLALTPPVMLTVTSVMLLVSMLEAVLP